MPDHDALDERLRAVERALTGDDADPTDLRDAAELAGEVESLADRLDAVEDRLDELDAATQALRGYVGNVRAVNDEVERRADAALAAVERLEADRDAADSLDAPDAGADTPDARAAATGAENAPAASGRDRPCGCATHSRASASRSPGPGTAPDSDGQSGSSDEKPGVLARVASTVTGLAGTLTGSR